MSELQKLRFNLSKKAKGVSYLETLFCCKCDVAKPRVVLTFKWFKSRVDPHVNLEIRELGEFLVAHGAGVLHNLPVHLVRVSVQGVLGREDSTAKATVKLLALLVD